MKLIRRLDAIQEQLSKSVVTIGNFDGLHLGHQQLIKRTHELANVMNVSSVLVTFEPYPQAYFANDDRIARLMSLRDKFLCLSDFHIDYFCVLPFNKKLAELSAEDFVSQILLNGMKAKTIIVGDDFRFGAKRLGDFELLSKLAQQYDFNVEQMPTLKYADERISSSRLRRALQQGDLRLAEKLLGRYYCLSGLVVKGDQRGREFGYPTANIYVGQKKLALSGIYVVEVEGIDDRPLPGIASVGYRPMYPTEKDLLEVYLFDFNRDIYHQHCTVRFLEKLRDEIKFSSEDELIEQMNKDAHEARQFFMHKKAPTREAF